MSQAEIEWIAKSYREKTISEINRDYDLANNIANFVWTLYSGKEIPEFKAIYPELFTDKQQEVSSESNQQLSKLKWYQMVIEHNRKYKQTHREVDK